MGLEFWTMEASSASDALRDPSKVLLEVYNAHRDSENFPAIVHEHFFSLFRTTDAFRTIPVLSARTPPSARKDGALVRFRAMVQDTSQSPEMYISRLADGTPGGWNLESGADDDLLRQSDYANLRECTVIWATSIPGESDWVSDLLDGGSEESDVVHQPARPHKFPIPDLPHVGAQVKIYYTTGRDPKPTDLIDFVGILHEDVLHGEQEELVSVPTLHVLYSRPVDRSVVFENFPSLENVSDVRQKLIKWIADQALDGDTSAAEWVLLVCMAQVQIKQTHLLPPSLTLSKLPPPPSPSTIPSLCTVLSLLLPQVITLPATLDKLNNEHFVPESKEEDLHSGYLQVPAGTTVVISELGLQEGNLLEKGVANVVAAQNAMSSQTILYAFPFSQFSFNTDMNFVVMTEGSKSAFFKTDIILPVRSQSASDYYRAEGDILQSPPLLAIFRHYLYHVKNVSVRVGKQMSEVISIIFASCEPIA
ncbi:hypothetical protein NEOLEDRAFT_1113066 [Neolentinus lepideus HHB14362 ss-1]|uniref:Mini-chromosome maintenance complex-binding protein n=1 Tax=Neolentinus lepideus HHB14362 ss-1 TaxID=1314782 RepID=A0A165T9K6_9AGAM|nr:hypothetical protein NEOLEDRAFT_1113066 [Neolentinus lepideus HHB14362 ss-1]